MRRPFPCLLAVVTLATPVASRAMTVSVNHSARLNIPGVANSVIVGNPAIADVTVVDSHTVYILGRGPGSTDIVVLDRAGRTLFKDDVRVGGSEHTVMLYRGLESTKVACDPGCGEAGSPAGAPKNDAGQAAFGQAPGGQAGGGQAEAGLAGVGSIAATTAAGAQTMGSSAGFPATPHP